jgi:class 3 adenylate cyclase
VTAVAFSVSTSSGAIVFTDIVGFTELTEAHGDDVALSLVERQERAVHASLPAGARVIKALGDGMLLWFERADEAIVASVRLQAEIDADDADDDALPLWVRTGVHWGTPRWRGDDIIGRDVNLASRVTALAAAREVLCTDAVVAQAGPMPGIELTSLGSVYVKGIVDAVPVLRAERLTVEG